MVENRVAQRHAAFSFCFWKGSRLNSTHRNPLGVSEKRMAKESTPTPVPILGPPLVPFPVSFLGGGFPY